LADFLRSVDARDIRLQPAGSPLLVRGDAELLEIVLRNLIDNALRYTPADSRITRLRPSARMANCRSASPTMGRACAGGVAAARRTLLSRSRGNAEGSGLGLAIVQRIAELHDARFEVENLAAGGEPTRQDLRRVVFHGPGDRATITTALDARGSKLRGARPAFQSWWRNPRACQAQLTTVKSVCGGCAAGRVKRVRLGAVLE
jgi:hypothetical protein